MTTTTTTRPAPNTNNGRAVSVPAAHDMPAAGLPTSEDTAAHTAHLANITTTGTLTARDRAEIASELAGSYTYDYDEGPGGDTLGAYAAGQPVDVEHLAEALGAIVEGSATYLPGGEPDHQTTELAAALHRWALARFETVTSHPAA